MVPVEASAIYRKPNWLWLKLPHFAKGSPLHVYPRKFWLAEKEGFHLFYQDEIPL